MENRILNEQIKKMMILSNYNTSKTLSENNILIERNVIRTVANDVKLLGTTIPKAEAEAIMKKIAKSPNKYPGLNNIDDVVKGVRAGTTEAVQVVFKTTKNPKLLNSLSTKLINEPNVMNKLVTNAKNQKKSVESYLRQLGYSDDAINALKKADKSGLYFKQAGKVGGTTKTTKPKTTKPKTRQGTFKSFRRRMGNRWRSMSRKQKILAVAGAGLGIYLLWRFFKSEHPDLFSDCVLGYMVDEDATLMAENNFGDGIIISDVPGLPPAYVGFKLFPDGRLETVQGGLSGTWSDDGNTVSVTIGGKTYKLPCKSTGISDDETTPDTTTRYRDCGDGPFSKGCYETDTNGPIHRLQSCLGVVSDGKFWTKTEAALLSQRNKTEVTIEEIDNICSTASGDEDTGAGATQTDVIDSEEDILSTDTNF
jgi:hypothetical protein